MQKRTVVLSTVLLSVATAGADPAAALKFTAPPSATRSGNGRLKIEFAVSTGTDVEVSILDPKGAVVRHLAAGVLGKTNAPPAPLKPGLAQSLEWDGKDDYRQPVGNGRYSTRVRAGMSVKLAQMAGGSPYLYILGGHGDHGRWGITGLERKSDGKVYVAGHSSTLGPVAIRRYDEDGNYEGTVFPPPAGNDPAAMKGWGIHTKPDGTYTIRFNRLTDPSVSTTIVDPELGMARMLPHPDPNRLSMWGGRMLVVGTDGTVPPQTEQMQGGLVKEPAFKGSACGPVFVCLLRDEKSFYLSGIYSGDRKGNPSREGFWRDGQVWKVDLATRKATPFLAVPEEDVNAITSRKSALGGIQSYSVLHGVAVDKDGHVFVANRLENCILVLDPDAKTIRKIPVKHPDAIAVSDRTGALYVTTRFGCERSGKGKVGMVKFDDWKKDDKPSVSLPNLAHTWYTGWHKHSYVVLCEKKDRTNVWLAYTEMPVRVYVDDGKEFSLLKDFRELAARQGCHGFCHVAVDRKTEIAYVGDNHSTFWGVGDWEQPEFFRLPVRAASIAIDSRNRFVYANPGGSVWIKKAGIHRYHLDKKGCPPANAKTGGNRLTDRLWSEWCFTGNSDIGFGVAPNGNIAGFDQRGNLLFFHGTEEKAPWETVKLANLKRSRVYGCVQFDLAGNLYVGQRYGEWKIPPPFKKDGFASRRAKIVKYAPTGTLESGNLFPTAPESPRKVYDVNFGSFDAKCIHHTPRFNVDEFGRIYYPMSVEPRISVMDNAGNEILYFGTWGNRDSTGGLPDDLVPTKDIPMALPASVAATDDYIYVGDMVNLRVLRIRKNFALQAKAK